MALKVTPNFPADHSDSECRESSTQPPTEPADCLQVFHLPEDSPRVTTKTIKEIEPGGERTQSGFLPLRRICAHP